MNKKSSAATHIEERAPAHKEQSISRMPRLDLLGQLQRQIDAIFEDFSKVWPGHAMADFPLSFAGLSQSTKRAFAFPQIPSCEVVDKPNEVVVRAEIPGIALADVEATLSQGVLTFQGEKKETHKSSQDGYMLAECSYGSFRRAIPIPENIDPDSVQADYKDGVITVYLPKNTTHPGHSQKIPIRAA